MRICDPLKLTCLARGHILDEIQTSEFLYESSCKCCGRTFQAGTALELLMLIPADLRHTQAVVRQSTVTRLA